jgi:anti-sigma factor RsiW
MTCHEVRALLNDYLDSSVAREEAARVRRHLADCESCRFEERGLRSLLERATTLPLSIEPPTDLWPAIDRRLDAVERPTPGTSTPRSPRNRSWTYGLLAASLLLAGIGAGYFLRGVGSPETPREPAPAATTTHTVSLGDGRASTLADAEQAILDAKSQLRAVFAERRDSLPPETARMVERNMVIIETAVAEIRGALDADPTNRELNRMLLAVQQRELDFLQRATALAARRSKS